MYMSIKQAAKKWKISDRRVRILCSEGKISGVLREGRSIKFHQRRKNRRTAAIVRQKACLSVLTGRKWNWIPDDLYGGRDGTADRRICGEIHL